MIREFASGCDVHLVGSPRLAAYAEAELAGAPVADAAITAEIAGCFIDKDGARTDTIVLACTHYPLLLERFRAMRHGQSLGSTLHRRLRGVSRI